MYIYNLFYISMKQKAKIVFYYISRTTGLNVLLGKRVTGDNEEFWWLPGGSIENNESAFDAAVRELSEELTPTRVLTESIDAYKKDNKIPPYITYTSGNSHNTLFFIKVTPYQGIKNDLPGIVDEFSEVKWISRKNLPQNMSREFIHIKKKFKLSTFKKLI